MSELRKGRPVEAYKIQIRLESDWRVVHMLHDREEAILEAVALTGEHGGRAPVRVLGVVTDDLSSNPHSKIIWQHRPPPQPPPDVVFEQHRGRRVAVRKRLSQRRTWFGLGGAALLGLLALSLYVGTHIRMDHVRY
jgi:hypothetical protein